MENKIITKFNKNKKEIVQVTLNNYKGHDLVDIRVYVENDSGELIATKRGISISTRLIPELKKALEKAEQEL